MAFLKIVTLFIVFLKIERLFLNDMLDFIHLQDTLIGLAFLLSEMAVGGLFLCCSFVSDLQGR